MIKRQRIVYKCLAVILLLVVLILFSSVSLAQNSVYNARINLKLEWNSNETQKPVVPRDEVKEIELNVEVTVETGPSFGEGIFEGYAGTPNVIHLEIVDTPSWCSAVLDKVTVTTPMVKKTNTTVLLYLTLKEDAPAYGGEGAIKIKVTAENSGLIQGTNKTFILKFITAYLPIIKTTLPESNTKRVSPFKNAVFPIQITNLGNARTKVFLEVENIPKGWTATVSDVLILDEQKGSTATAYLTVVPSSSFGYHYDNANIRVKITPAMAENVENKGTPIYANFVIQNRGFSSDGIVFILVLMVSISLIIAVIIFILKRGNSKR